MVAEHALNDPRDKGDLDEPPEWTNTPDEEDESKFIGDLMPVDFDPLEVERRIKSEIVILVKINQ